MVLSLSDEDRLFRKIVKINRGNFDKICDELRITKTQVISKLRNKRHKKWWQRLKANIVRENANARNRRSYARRKLAAIEPDLQRMISNSEIS